MSQDRVCGTSCSVCAYDGNGYRCRALQAQAVPGKYCQLTATKAADLLPNRLNQLKRVRQRIARLQAQATRLQSIIEVLHNSAAEKETSCTQA